MFRITSSPPPPTSPAPDTSKAKPTSDQSNLAQQLRNVSNSGNAHTASQSTFQNSTIVGRPVDILNMETPQEKRFKTFSTIYTTNAGCEEIKAAMRGETFKLSVTKIMGEIERRNGPEAIASYKKNKIDVKLDMTIFEKTDLQLVAKEMYAAADPARMSGKVVHRGQGMTPAGIIELMDLKESNTPIKAGQFLSCDTEVKTAREFAANHDAQHERPVMFQIRGYSNVRLRPRMEVLGERESLFSPHATFTIDKIGKGGTTGYFVVQLTEIAPTKNAVALPY